ncbi:MAG: outer membrane protein assembly factor BamD, partial [Muribaculaceae bacterium]|nr:outer membrane protein assembly factor BamD [Muribaculaceae bacterium]
MIKRLTIIMALACMLAGCGEYNNVMKSSDLEYKYDYAKRAFENKRYAQAYTILTELVPIFRGTPHAEESL